jgi:hypothetical protein
MSRLSHRLDVSNHYFVGQTEFDGEDFVKPWTLPSVTRIAWAIDSALKRWVQRKHDGHLACTSTYHGRCGEFRRAGVPAAAIADKRYGRS